MRFELDDERVQGLLMGEQLYGDRSLAIRELYQNAVDACRHLDARRQYLGLDFVPAGEVRVRFTEGTDQAGERYLECSDTGVGMGLDELEKAFAHAGVRSTDRQEFVQELEDYRNTDSPVSLWTNSQFGVGVLSYFMLASRIDITTTLFERDGSLGRQLRVVIPRQGADFEIHDEGPGTRAGTTIRLHTKPDVDVSAVSALRDLVIVCPFAMSVHGANGLHHAWRASAINTSSNHFRPRSGFAPVEHEETGVWWVDGWGPVLADGIWVETFLYGALINLTGEQMPKLTIDRRRILEFDEHYCDRVTLDAVPTALGAAWPFVGTQLWLDSAFPFNPALVDAIVERAAEGGDLVIQQQPVPLNVNAAGYLVGEGNFDKFSDTSRAAAWSLCRRLAAGEHRELGIDVSTWQDAVVRARPTDAVFLATAEKTVSVLTIQQISPWAPDASAIYDAERHLRWPIERLVARARVLGLPVPPGAESLPPSNDFIRALLNRNSSWKVDEPREFRAFDVSLTADELHLTHAEADDLLRARGLSAQSTWNSLVDTRPTTTDLVCASQNADGVAPWRSPKSSVRLDAVFRSSLVLGLTVGDVSARLRRLGFDVDVNPDYQPFLLDHSDMLLVSTDIDGLSPFLRRAQPISKERLERVLWQTGLPEDEAQRRLARLGHPTWTEARTGTAETGPSVDEEPDSEVDRLAEHLAGGCGAPSPIDRRSLTRRDVDLAAVDDEGTYFWPAGGEVPYLHVWSRAWEAGRSEKKTIKRLRRLGYTAARNPFEKLKRRDRTLLSRKGDGDGPWREPGDSISYLEIALLCTGSERSLRRVLADAERLGLLVDFEAGDLPTVRPGPVPPGAEGGSA